jgi:hypothetical protein
MSKVSTTQNVSTLTPYRHNLYKKEDIKVLKCCVESSLVTFHQVIEKADIAVATIGCCGHLPHGLQGKWNGAGITTITSREAGSTRRRAGA